MMRTIKKTVGENVISRLIDEIIEVKLLPGQEISAAELAQVYEVSKTPLREAFLKLSEQYLIEIYPQRGSKIALIDMSIVEQYRFLRCLVEPEIVRGICEQQLPVDYMKLYELVSLQKMYEKQKDVKKGMENDAMFHRTLFQTAGKDEVFATLNQMSVQYKRLNYIKLRDGINSQMYIHEHEEIVEALKAQDGEKASKIMKEHLERIGIEKESIIKNYPDYFKT